ncbi:hypothetical protein SASPL_115213 [Salvia splendens]|uniref:NB-ARC domain-containing protein n=1 Tax=Salvia splendens TaxID=180675 RepID=A0A8X8Y2T0_SALSN|nr:hypothetical protein SASPL_115213 [Salvia splendens]
MATYAALASLAQTTNHAISNFSTNAKENITSIHEYAIILLTFLEDYPERSNRWEAKLRDVAHKIEDIIEEFMWRQSFYGGEEMSSSLYFEEELRNVTVEFCLIAGDVMDERPAYSSLSLSSSSSAARVAPTGNGVAIGLNENGKVFANSNCPPELDDVGKKIAKSCGGLPLAVVLVAGFLSVVNKNPSSWEEISENINPIVGRESEAILSLSYTHLSHHLRPCLLFIAMFPEDENIRASKLIRLCKKSDGKIKCCSLHDMVRDLCIRKAHDEKFLRVVPESMSNERRISLSVSDLDDIWCPTIHTMLCFQLQSFPSSPTFVRRFRLLRILDTVSQTSKELSSLTNI